MQQREERFQRLVDADAYSALWRYCCRLSTRREDAEDLLQETLALAYSRLAQLRDEAVVKGWLFAIARNLYISRLRRERREHARNANEPAWRQAPCPEGAGPPADAAQAVTPVPTRYEVTQAGCLRHQHEDETQAGSLRPPDDPPAELLRGVREAVARLPVAQREAVELFHLEDLSLAETAAALNVSVGNVKQRLWRARQSLLAQLSGSLAAGELERMF